MARLFILIGGVNGFLSVALGAFGAHALRARLSADMLEVYKTGVNYHMTHALALILVGILAARTPDNALLARSGWLFTAGIVLFSGSLYLLAACGVRAFGVVTPLGGLCFLAGWLLFILAAARIQ